MLLACRTASLDIACFCNCQNVLLISVGGSQTTDNTGSLHVSDGPSVCEGKISSLDLFVDHIQHTRLSLHRSIMQIIFIMII